MHISIIYAYTHHREIDHTRAAEAGLTTCPERRSKLRANVLLTDRLFGRRVRCEEELQREGKANDPKCLDPQTAASSTSDRKVPMPFPRLILSARGKTHELVKTQTGQNKGLQ